MLFAGKHHTAEKEYQRIRDVAVYALEHIGVSREVVLVGASDYGDEGNADCEQQEYQHGDKPAEQRLFANLTVGGLARAFADDAVKYQPPEHQCGGEAGDVVGVLYRPLVVADVPRRDHQWFIFEPVYGAEYHLREGRDNKQSEDKNYQQIPDDPQGFYAYLGGRPALFGFLAEPFLHVSVQRLLIYVQVFVLVHRRTPVCLILLLYNISAGFAMGFADFRGKEIPHAGWGIGVL